MNQAGRITLLAMLLCLTALFPSCKQKKVSGEAGLDGMGTFTYAIAKGRASVSVVFEDLHLDQGVTIPLSRPVGAFVELAPDLKTMGTLFMISVPLESLFQGTGDLPWVGLPDGRPIPGVTNGVLGALTVNLPVLGTIFLYMGTDVFGIFFPIPLPTLPAMVSFKISDEKGNLLGVLYGIPKSAKGAVSGALFLFPVEGSRSSGLLSRVQ